MTFNPYPSFIFSAFIIQHSAFKSYQTPFTKKEFYFAFPLNNNTENWKIWIDYNRDGDFADTGENVFSNSGTSTVTGSFTVSASAARGTARMRVSMRAQNNPSNCGSFNYGEVEDYTVNIQ